MMAVVCHYLDSDLLHNVELLQRQGMLWVIDRSDQMYLKVKNDSDLFIISFSGNWQIFVRKKRDL